MESIVRLLNLILGLKIGLVKRLGKKHAQLKQLKEHLIYERDAIKEEKIKQLRLGNMPRRESKPWVDKTDEIIRQANDISNNGWRNSDQDFKQLKKMRDEIVDQLKKLIEHDLMVNAQQKITKTTTSLESQGEKYGAEKKTEMVNLQRNAGTKAKPTVGSETPFAGEKEVAYKKKMPLLKDLETLIEPPIAASIHVLEDEKKYEIEAAKVGLTSMEISEAETVPVAGVKGKMTPELSDKYEAASEIIPAPAQKYLLIPESMVEARTKAEPEHEIISIPGTETAPMHETGFESIPAVTKGVFSFQEAETVETEIVETNPAVVEARTKAEPEHEIISIPGTETAPIHETAFESIPAVTKGVFSFQETEIVEKEIVETNPTGTVGILSSQAKEIEPVPSESEEDDQMKPALRRSIQKSVGTIISAVKPKILLSSSEKDENSPINEVEVGRYYPTPGGQVSPGPVINAKRSIYHTVQKILGCMRDGTASRIGIHGNGGIGKTSVLKALFNHTEIKNMFDSVLWVTVSRYSSTRKIQNQVAKQLLSCPSGFETDLAIFHALQSKNFLLLLDDVWEWIDLEAVGIPIPDQENGSRIILTTRFLDVCHIMGADTRLEVDVLSRDEAWELFRYQVGRIIDSTDIEPYARAIVAECGGLPLTIVVTGRALRKENDVSGWTHALRELLLPGTLGKHGSEAVIQRLKFSYDKLKARDVKDCFLYCALLQEDPEVNISDLINYFADESLVAGNSADAWEKGQCIIKILLEAALLESTDDGLSVKMHDVIRDLASYIMSPAAEGCQFLVQADLRLSQELESPKRDGFLFSEGHQFLLGAGAGLTEPPSNEKWEQAEMIFLMDNNLFSLPESPICPKLLTLFLQRNYCLRVLPISFFNRMPYLQVLNLSKTRIKSLPQSLFKLKRLKVLLLRDCERCSMLPPEIEALEQLELLDLRGTKIYSLPIEIGNLACLKHMLVSFYGTNNSSEFVKLPTELVSDGIISRLLRLNELSIAVYPGDKRWNSSRVESIVMEVGNLKELKTLDFYFPEVEPLEQFTQKSLSWQGKSLSKFNFLVGHNVNRIVARVPDDVEYEFNQQDRCLRFVNGETLPNVVLEVLSRTTALYLDHHLYIHNLAQFGVSNIISLKFCILRECPEIQTVMDGNVVDGSALQLLEHLSIHYLWNLRGIWKGPVTTGSLSKLRFLSMHTCPQLTFVLAHSMLQNLGNLEVLIVEDCPAVKDVVFNDNDNDSGDIVLPKLKKLRLHYLPNLVSIWKGSWPPIEHISIYNCPSLKNLHMRVNVIDTIKKIKAELEWWDGLEWEETALFLQLQACFTEICYDDL